MLSEIIGWAQSCVEDATLVKPQVAAFFHSPSIVNNPYNCFAPLPCTQARLATIERGTHALSATGRSTGWPLQPRRVVLSKQAQDGWPRVQCQRSPQQLKEWSRFWYHRALVL